MSDLSKYFHAQDKVDAASWQYNYAGQKLENERIKMRLAEILSQHEPLNKLIGLNSTEEGYKEMRDKLYAAAFYVVVGRMP